MVLLGLEKNLSQLISEDLCGKVFQFVEEAKEFFMLYARMIGYSVRKGHMQRLHDGIVKI